MSGKATKMKLVFGLGRRLGDGVGVLRLGSEDEAGKQRHNISKFEFLKIQ